MADDTESTPFLTDNDHDQDTTPVKDPEDDVMKATLPVNAHFKRPIKILTSCVSFLSGITTMILIAAFVIIQVGPFRGYTYAAQYVVQALGITAFVSLILSTLMIFLQLPIIISFTINLILAILILIYAGNIFGGGWPRSDWCYDYYGNPYGIAQCIHLQVAVMALMGVSSGLGFLVGLFYLVLLLLRIIAVSRSRSWERTSIFSFVKRTSIFPEGEYTLQFTLKGLKKAAPKAGGGDGRVRGQSDSGDEQQQLIDT